MELDPADHPDAMHRVITSIVTPRPIGWISTRNEKRDNLAPYSYFNAVSSSPPAVMFSGSTTDGEPKDAGGMAIETGEFVVNLVTEDLAEEMDRTSAPLDDTSEFDFAGLGREEAATVDAPRVAEAAAALECTVFDTLQVFDNLVVVGAVEHIAVDERITTDGVVDMEKIDSVGRLGGPFYTGLDFLDLRRSNFGAWDGPVPAGFELDETGSLQVDPDDFEAVREAVARIDDGESLDEVAAEADLDREELAECVDRRALYLDGHAEDERVEAALAQAGVETEFVY